MGKCAFCDHEGKLSCEHIVSQWLGELFPGPITQQYVSADSPKTFRSLAIDYKARVVCKKCNETWMSDIENDHAKPVLTPLVTGQTNIPITKESAASIALFAFKTAIVLDHANRTRPGPFFSLHIRHGFRKHRLIPPFVQMWMCGYADHRSITHIRTIYHKGKSDTGYALELYTCTCAFGYFTFQVLAVKQTGNFGIRSLAPFKVDLAVPFWPQIPNGFVWPHRLALITREHFDIFAKRWENVEFTH